MPDLNATAGQLTMAPLATVPGVDIVATGTWQLSSGEMTFTKTMLADAIDAAQCPSVGPPIIKLGHVDPRFDGEPAVGKVVNMALSTGGNKITGDLASLPGWLGTPDENGATVIGAAYPNRSIEGTFDFECQQGHIHPFVITGLALLGVTSPGVGVLNSLDDVAALYGVNAAADRGDYWTLEVKPMTDAVFAAGVTVEDVRQAYYGATGTSYSMWITEMQMDPPQLICADEATRKVYRVPVKIKGGTVTFGDPVEVQVEYVDVPAQQAAASGRVCYASAEDSRAGVEAAWSAATQVKNMGDSPSASALKKMFALPGDTKSASKLPHHTCSADGVVDGPDAAGCSAAIGALNGGRGGLTGVSQADKQSAYNHLAAHLRSLGKEPPEFTGSAADDEADTAAADGEPDTAAADGGHVAFGTADTPESHTHSHTANGSQGGDQTHSHEHQHAGDGKHDHAHAQATGTNRNGGADVEFTDEQRASLRASLGLGDEDELTAEAFVSAASALRTQADAKVAASGPKLPSTVVAVERSNYEALQREVEAGKKYRERKQREERDDVIAAAVREGKFAKAREGDWRRVWDNDPDGTRQILASLPRNAVPVSDIGTPGGSDDDLLDEEYSSLFPPGTSS